MFPMRSFCVLEPLLFEGTVLTAFPLAPLGKRVFKLGSMFAAGFVASLFGSHIQLVGLSRQGRGGLKLSRADNFIIFRIVTPNFSDLRVRRREGAAVHADRCPRLSFKVSNRQSDSVYRMILFISR